MSLRAFYLLHDKLLEWTEIKASEDNKLNLVNMIIPDFDRVEIMWKNKKKVCLLAFSPFPTMFFSR